MSDTPDTDAAAPTDSPAPHSEESGGMGDRRPLYLWTPHFPRGRRPLGATLQVLQAPADARMFVLQPPWSWWEFPTPESEPVPVASPLVDLLRGGSTMEEWSRRWFDQRAVDPEQFSAVPVPTLEGLDLSCLMETLERHVPPVLEDTLRFTFPPVRRLVADMERVLHQSAAGTGGEGAKLSADELFRLEVLMWSGWVLGEPVLPWYLHVLPEMLRAVGRKMSVDDFTRLSQAARLATIGLPDSWNLGLASRVHWIFDVAPAGRASVLARAGDDEAKLARRAVFTRRALTKSLPAVAWLEWFWCAECGLLLRLCTACRQPYVAPDARHGFCPEHTAPPWAKPVDASAYARARERTQERKQPVPTWHAWKAAKSPLEH